MEECHPPPNMIFSFDASYIILKIYSEQTHFMHQMWASVNSLQAQEKPDAIVTVNLGFLKLPFGVSKSNSCKIEPQFLLEILWWLLGGIWSGSN